MTTPTTELLMALHDAAVAAAIQVALANLGDRDNATRDVLLAALQARNQQGPIKTWQERLEETCPALGPMHIHACVEEVNDAMQAEIDALRAAMQAREGEGEQEPIARIMFNDDGRKTDNLIDCDLPVGTLLYAAPQGAPK